MSICLNKVELFKQQMLEYRGGLFSLKLFEKRGQIVTLLIVILVKLYTVMKSISVELKFREIV